VKIGLYTDAGGTPGTLLTSAEGSVAGAGAQEIPVPQKTVFPGTYWIATNFAAATYIHADPATLVTYKYVSSFGYANPLPSSFPAPSTTTYRVMNYYLKGFGF
jgi:hypothetical protein